MQPLNFDQIASKLTNAGFTITTGLTEENKLAPLLFLDGQAMGWLESGTDNCWDIVATSGEAFDLFNETLTGLTLWPWFGTFKRMILLSNLSSDEPADAPVRSVS